MAHRCAQDSIASYPWVTWCSHLLGRGCREQYRVFCRRTAFNLRTAIDVQSRQDMETRFDSQIEGVLTATKKLVSYTLHSAIVEISNAILAKLF
jgi:hypothetical protein